MKTVVYIQNLKCGGCETTILNKLAGMHGISNVSVDHENSAVSFTHELNTNIDLVRELLGKLGYPVIDEANSLGKIVKSYQSCAMGRLHEKT